MIVVTGAAGFIGSCLVKRLNAENYNAVIAVDKFDQPRKNRNLENATVHQRVDRDQFLPWLDKNHERVEFIFHIGARTDTAEFDKQVFDRLNVTPSKEIWRRCVDHQIPLIYASSAATYGLGEAGFDDNEEKLNDLHPLNPYGWSKLEFDIWALGQREKPFYWAGLKFFNVYGPNEYHKGRMASVVWHAADQIKREGKLKLFRSHNPRYKDGRQLRDFIYVKDVVEACMFLMHTRGQSGIYNLGSGVARTFEDLASAVFHSLGKEKNIEYIDTPVDIRDKYQYYTQANVAKLRGLGFSQSFHSLESGIDDYIRNFLQDGVKYY